MAPKRQPALKNPSSDSDSSEELSVSEKQAPIPNQLQISESDEDEESSDEELEDDTKPSTGKSAPTRSDSSDDTSGSDTDSGNNVLSPTASGFKIKLIDSKRMDKKINANSVGTLPPSDSEDGESGSDTDSSDTEPSPTVSGVTKPMNDSAKKKNPAQNPNAAGTKLAATRAASAKKLNDKETQKKGRLMNGARAMEEKKSPIVRIWSDDDEVAIVQGMFEYRTKKGCDPYADRDAFHEFMKKFLSIEVTKNQLMAKIRRLKSRYENNVKKGKDQASSKPRVLKFFELSKKVWGGDGAAAVESRARNGKRKASQSVSVEDLVAKENSDEKINKKAKKKNSIEVKKSLDLVNKNGIDEVEEGSGWDGGFWDAYPHFKEALELENSGYFSKSGQRAMEVKLSKIGAAKAKEMDDKWKGFHVKETELNLLRSELAAEQTKLVLETIKAANPG